MEFFNSWTTFISETFRRFTSHPVLLKSPNRPGFSLTTAVREQHLSSTITASYQTPFFLAEIPFAVQEQ